MLGKLLKHEFKATSRLLLPVFLILAVFTLMDRIVLSLDIFHGALAFIPGIITFVFVLSIIGVIVVSFIIIVIRFYKNLVKDEGYLMFTLPTNPSQLITSKLIVATVWSIASILACGLAIFIVATFKVNPDEIATGFHTFFRELFLQLDGDGVLLIIEFFVILLLGLINNILLVYVSIALGQLFNGHKLLGSIVSFISINIGLQILSSVLMAILGVIFKDALETITIIPHMILPGIIVITLLLNAAYYFVTNLIFRRKLNLE